MRWLTHQWQYPAVKHGYEGASVSGRLLSSLDSGYLLSVLAACARAGDPVLAEEVLQQSLAGRSPNHPQLEALYIAHCNAASFEGALHVLGKLDDLDGPDSGGDAHAHLVKPLVRSAGKSELLWKQAHAAWRRVGTDAGPDGGVTTAGMNGLLRAARALGLHSHAHALYASRAKLRARRGRRAGATHSDAQASSQGAEHTLQPNLHTFHGLLRCCLDTGDSAGGRALLTAMAQHRPVLVGTTNTYELAVRLLCLTDKYAGAFEYIAEAERRGTRVSRLTLEVLRDTCKRYGDAREAELDEQLAARVHQ
jgi:hypothetical protein